MRRPSSSMAASVSFLDSICLLAFPLLLFVGLLPSLVGLRRLREFDEISARALEPFDLVEPMSCPCLLLVIRGMAAASNKDVVVRVVIVEMGMGIELN